MIPSTRPARRDVPAKESDRQPVPDTGKARAEDSVDKGADETRKSIRDYIEEADAQRDA